MLLWLFFGSGCHEPAAADPCVESGLTWESFGVGFTATYCRSCHSAATPDRRGAPVGVDFETEADVRGAAASIRRTVLEEGSMPIGGGVQPLDLERLDEWLGCSQ